jgi:hypothetical protein
MAKFRTLNVKAENIKPNDFVLRQSTGLLEVSEGFVVETVAQRHNFPSVMLNGTKGEQADALVGAKVRIERTYA